MTEETTRMNQPRFFERKSIRQRVQKILVYIVLSAMSVIFIIPLLWMLSTSFKDPSLIYKSPPVWIPPEITLENFERGLELMIPSFEKLFFNSTFITVLSMVGAIFSSSLVGFAFAVFKARGKNVLFTLMLATLMVPMPVTLIPQFILFTKLDWVNTYLPLIVPQFFAAPFFVFMFRQFFGSIPRELFDSGELDGCSPLGLYWRIAFPLARPAFATAAIFSFLASWNDLLNPLVYLNDLNKFTLALGLSNFQATNYTLLQYMMPMALLGLLPILILFFLAQKYFVQGIVTTGMKG